MGNGKSFKELSDDKKEEVSSFLNGIVDERKKKNVGSMTEIPFSEFVVSQKYAKQNLKHENIEGTDSNLLDTGHIDAILHAALKEIGDQSEPQKRKINVACYQISHDHEHEARFQYESLDKTLKSLKLENQKKRQKFKNKNIITKLYDNVIFKNKKDNIDNSDSKLNFVLNINRNHWISLTVVQSLKEKETYIVYRNPYGRDIDQNLKSHLRKIFGADEDIKIVNCKKALQIDAVTCGVNSSIAALGDTMINPGDIIRAFKKYGKNINVNEGQIVAELDGKIKNKYEGLLKQTKDLRKEQFPQINGESNKEGKNERIDLEIEQTNKAIKEIPSRKPDKEPKDLGSKEQNQSRDSSKKVKKIEGTSFELLNLSKKEDRNKVAEILKSNKKVQVIIVNISIEEFNKLSNDERKAVIGKGKKIESDRDSRYFLDRAATLHNRFDNHIENKTIDNTKGDSEITRRVNITKKLADLYKDPKQVIKDTKRKHQNKLKDLGSHSTDEAHHQKIDKLKNKIDGKSFNH